ncbi:hypothetical protein D3C74_148740 [compost metagenome]
MAPRTDETVWVLTLPRTQTDIRDFYRNVLNTIEGKSKIIVTNEQVMRVMKLMEAAFLSDSINQAVNFE